MPIEDALGFYPAVYVSEKQAVRFSNGGELELIRLKGRFDDGIYRIFSPEDKFLGLAEASNENNVMKPIKVIGS